MALLGANPFFSCGAILHFSVCKLFPVVCLFQWMPSFKEGGERPLGGDITHIPVSYTHLTLPTNREV